MSEIIFMTPTFPIPRGRARTTDAELNPDKTDALVSQLHGENRAVALDVMREMLEPQPYPYEFADGIKIDISNSNALVKHLIDRQDFGVIYGPPAAGKSTFATDLAQRIARGDAWRTHQVKPAGVVYICAEAPQSIRKRFAAWNEVYASDVQQNTPLALLLAAPNLLDPVAVESLIDEIRFLTRKMPLPLGAVFIDTLAAVLVGASENDSETMGAVIAFAQRIRDEFKSACIFLHHAGKDQARGMRGHSSLLGAADVVIRIADGVAKVEKARDAIAGHEFPFEIDGVMLGVDEDHDPVTAALLKHADTPGPSRRVEHERKLPPSARVALMALREALDDHGKAMPGSSTIPRGVRACKLEDWRRQFLLRYGSEPEAEGRGRRAVNLAFQRGREQLAAHGTVMISDPYVWLT